MIVLTVDGPLGKEKELKDFHIKTINKDFGLLGTNVIMILKIEPTDDLNLIIDTECRIKARFKKSLCLLKEGITIENEEILGYAQLDLYKK